MRVLKHLPEDQWPPEDRRLFESAYAPGDIFDDNRGPGTHLAESTRQAIWFGWRRWLGFLKTHSPADLDLPAPDRITPQRVQAYVEHLGVGMTPTSVGTMVAQLYDGARLIAPNRDWSWLRATKTRLLARGQPEDRFDRLVAPHQTLDLGIELMEEAIGIPATGHRRRELQYRDGLIIAILSLFPFRRRSLAALTVSRHVELGEDRADILLFSEDTKGKRAESVPVPDQLLPYLKHYLAEIRRRICAKTTDALWPSRQGCALGGDQIYKIVRRWTEARFGKSMALHDFRRAAATFLAIEAPEKIGLTPGILQHASPDTGDRHYNLARGTMASRRHGKVISAVRARLQSPTQISRGH
jgi:site-specific recombinase XerD